MDDGRSANSQPRIPNWLAWARKIQAISQIGLTYAAIQYDRERHENEMYRQPPRRRLESIADERRTDSLDTGHGKRMGRHSPENKGHQAGGYQSSEHLREDGGPQRGHEVLRDQLSGWLALAPARFRGPAVAMFRER